ncbi:MAG: AgmX/PglI C-terminal domain-containing protein [Proteobacteria bacterium]|nr:AgmX/PglI C-terminal domain-containing protein [Pseudomonadota bacterium]
MKIICSGCGANHWLSDMQLSDGGCNVICPHCNSTNFVDASMVDPASLEPRWYYAMNDDSVGPLSTRDMEFSFQNGQITFDSYVWCDGLPDWMALGAVNEFDYLRSPVQGEPYGANEATRVAGAGGGFGGYPLNDIGGNGEETAAIDITEFSGGGFSPFDNDSSAGIVGMDGKAAADDEPVFDMSPGSVAPSANDMVGAKSENSVLFSLSSLQAVGGGALSGGSSSPAAASSAPAAGLIDVKALASSGPVVRRRQAEVVNSFGNASQVPVATVLPLGTKKDNTKLYILIGGGVVLLLAIIGIVAAVVSSSNAKEKQKQEQELAMKQMELEKQKLEQEMEKSKLEAQALAEKAAADAKAAAEAEAEAKAKEKAEAAEREREALAKAEEEKAAAEAEESAKSGSGSAKKPSAPAPKETKVAAAAPAAPKPANTGSGSSAAKKTDTKKQAAAAAPAPAAAGLTKAEVQSVIRGAFGDVRTCSRTSQTKGKMKVSFVIKGDGRVSGAKVISPEFANTPVASCVLKVVNGMKFRASGAADLPITYPFEIQ